MKTLLAIALLGTTSLYALSGSGYEIKSETMTCSEGTTCTVESGEMDKDGNFIKNKEIENN